MLMLSMSASTCGMMRQQEGAAAVNRTIAYGQREIVDIFETTHDGWCAPHEPWWHKKDTRRVRRGLGKGSGVLLPGVTAFFLAKDAKSCHRCRLFSLIVACLLPRGARDSRFRLRSDRRKWFPLATTLLNPWNRGMNIAYSLPWGTI